MTMVSAADIEEFIRPSSLAEISLRGEFAPVSP